MKDGQQAGGLLVVFAVVRADAGAVRITAGVVDHGFCLFGGSALPVVGVLRVFQVAIVLSVLAQEAALRIRPEGFRDRRREGELAGLRSVLTRLAKE